jgi:hypothetical protein
MERDSTAKAHCEKGTHNKSSCSEKEKKIKTILQYCSEKEKNN